MTFNLLYPSMKDIWNENGHKMPYVYQIFEINATSQLFDLEAKYFRIFRQTLGRTFGVSLKKIEGGRVTSTGLFDVDWPCCEILYMYGSES